MRAPDPLLIRNVRPLGADPAAPTRAYVCENGIISWSGPDSEAPEVTASVVDCPGAVITPAFVDAHVHATATGLVLTGLDLSAATSVGDLLDRISAARRGGAVLLGHGWDESRWPRATRPTLAQLLRATGGSPAYLSRTDLHSALATPDLLADVDHDDGWVRLEAHHAVRARALAAVTTSQAREAQRATRAEAARLGIHSIHEMSGPEVASAEDLRALLELAATEPGPGIVPYWGALNDFDTAVELGAQPGGDLFVDGSFGSRTACLGEPYADEPGTRGALRYPAEEISTHVEGAMERGLQAGFHCIGDQAIDAVLRGIAIASERFGVERVRTSRHRLEHLELPTGAAIGRAASLGVIASVQPAFDARWASAMYPGRLGTDRAARTNPFTQLYDAGVPLALGSDAPVTPLDPWGAIRAAVTAQHPLSGSQALRAHTLGGAHAARDGRVGADTLMVGAPASLAVWTLPGVAAEEWLRAVVSGAEPRNLLTVADGRTIFTGG